VIRPAAVWRLWAVALMRAAAMLMPAARIDWIRAMRAEFDHFENDRHAFLWAAGCLRSGINERMNTMIYGDLKISRWLLAPEMLLCFAPLTLLWLDGIDGSSGLLRLTSAAIHKHFTGVPGGTVLLMSMLAGVVLASIGPIALIAAFRMILRRTPIKHAALRVALLAAPILYGLMSVAVRAVETGSAAFDLSSSDAFDFWSGIFLLSVLPALGALHLLRLSQPPWRAATSPA
jgi:hypothetical protein